MNKLPYFYCNNNNLNTAYRLAIACVSANTITIKTGILDKPSPCVMAGMEYDSPWTRDTAINIINAIGLLDKEVSKNMLLSVLEDKDSKIFIGGEYWDAVIWGLAAYKLYLIYKDKEFLDFSYKTLQNTLDKFEREEFDDSIKLFRGPAVYGDGVAAYPDKYVKNNRTSAIWTWQNYNKDKYPIGYGLPMKALSTNCLYVEVYKTMSKIATELSLDGSEYLKKAELIKNSINKNFWNERKGSYNYLFNESDAQEGLGLVFAILFDIANLNKKEKIFNSTYITDFGIPCLWPNFPRYESYGIGRHCGTVWPHIQGFWAKACIKNDKFDKFDKELFALSANAVRDKQFAELYHPKTGEDYGGIQEISFDEPPKLYSEKSCSYQTWSATAFLNMVFEGIFGINFDDKLSFKPYLPNGVSYASLINLQINGLRYDIEVFKNEDKAGQFNLIEKENIKYLTYYCK